MKRVLAAIAFVTFGLTVWLLARQHLSLEVLVDQEERLRGLIRRDPWSTFLAGFALYTIISLFPGTSGKSILCGWFYGFWLSLLMVTSALTLAGLGGYLIARFVLRGTIRERWPTATDKAEAALERDGTFYLLTVRLLHVPFTVVNYVAGAVGVRAFDFTWTTALGLVPSTMIFVGVGSQLPTLRQLVDGGAERLLDPWLLVALTLMGIAPWAFRALVRTARRSERSTEPSVASGESS